MDKQIHMIAETVLNAQHTPSRSNSKERKESKK